MARPRAHCALVLLLALGGCGGDGPAAETADGRVRITLDDFRIKPQVVRSASRNLVFEIRNTGRLGHNFLVRGPKGVVQAQISVLLPGESETLRVRLRRGDWTMYCSVANHEELGMHGRLEVR